MFLQILSLHNCTKLRSTALSAIAGGCPQLRMLMLGGCSLSLTPSTSSSSGVAKVATSLFSAKLSMSVHVYIPTVWHSLLHAHTHDVTMSLAFRDATPSCECLSVHADWRGNEAHGC